MLAVTRIVILTAILMSGGVPIAASAQPVIAVLVCQQLLPEAAADIISGAEAAGGNKLKLEIHDVQCDDSILITTAKRISNDRVAAVIGHMTLSSQRRAQEIFSENNILFFPLGPHPADNATRNLSSISLIGSREQADALLSRGIDTMISNNMATFRIHNSCNDKSFIPQRLNASSYSSGSSQIVCGMQNAPCPGCIVIMPHISDRNIAHQLHTKSLYLALRGSTDIKENGKKILFLHGFAAVQMILAAQNSASHHGGPMAASLKGKVTKTILGDISIDSNGIRTGALKLIFSPDELCPQCGETTDSCVRPKKWCEKKSDCLESCP